jgi:hypothetical protein
MPTSEPPSSKSLDAGWGLFAEREEAPDSDDETRMVQMSAVLLKSFPLIEEGQSSDERDTLPPPIPVSEYVQTMMQQAREEPEPFGKSQRPFNRMRTTPPTSLPGGDGDRPAPPSRRAEGWSVPPAILSLPLDDDDEEVHDRFTLIAFQPERLGDSSAADEAHTDPPPTPQLPGVADLPLEETPSSVRPTFTVPRFPTPMPSLLASLAPQHRTSTTPPHPPSSRGEPPLASFPPTRGAVWPSSPQARRPIDLDDPPATQRGLAAPDPFDTRPQAGTHRFGSIGDASVQAGPPSSERGAILPSEPAPADPFSDVRELYDAGDFRSALVMVEALLEVSPDHFEAQACAASCRELLSKKYLGRLGGLAKILRVAMPPDEIRWLSLDHKAGFLLSCIDGTSSIEEVLDVACMQEFEAIRILHDFRELGVIEILPDPRAPRR